MINPNNNNNNNNNDNNNDDDNNNNDNHHHKNRQIWTDTTFHQMTPEEHARWRQATNPAPAHLPIHGNNMWQQPGHMAPIGNNGRYAKHKSKI